MKTFKYLVIELYYAMGSSLRAVGGGFTFSARARLAATVGHFATKFSF